MRRSSKHIVTLGFLLMGVMIAALSAYALVNMNRAQEHIKSIVGVNTVKVGLVSQMRNAARDRALILHRITLMSDPFEIDAEMLKYSQSAVDFREVGGKLCLAVNHLGQIIGWAWAPANAHDSWFHPIIEAFKNVF